MKIIDMVETYLPTVPARPVSIRQVLPISIYSRLVGLPVDMLGRRDATALFIAVVGEARVGSSPSRQSPFLTLVSLAFPPYSKVSSRRYTEVARLFSFELPNGSFRVSSSSLLACDTAE